MKFFANVFRTLAGRPDSPSAADEVLLKTRPPADIEEAEIQQIQKLILSANQVYSEQLRQNFPRCRLIVTAHSKGKLVGTAAIKVPTDEYRRKLSERAQFDLSNFFYEFGYAVVQAKFRGQHIATKMLVARLDDVSSGVYTTVHANNAAVLHLALKHGFARVGSKWRGREEEICLLVKRD
jgi:RimJ/RimL family protein N-acetyltransferase